MKTKLKIETVKIDEIHPNPDNVKLHPDEQIEQIANSIEEFGNNDPIAVAEDNMIIEGHGRLLALQKLGRTEVDIIRLDHLTPEQRKAYTLVHNQLTMNTGYDMEQLEIELAKIENIDMSKLGFDNVILDLEVELDDDFEMPDDIEARTSTIKQGDLFQLGNHRLLCGDSTSIEDVNKLMDGQEADMVNTDPPYNVNYEGQDGMKIQNDNMSDSQFLQFLTDVFAAMKHALKPGGAYYIWHADSERLNFSKALLDNDMKERQTLIWVKNSLVLGRQDYNWKHEPCLYGWKPGAAHFFIEDFTKTTTLEDLPNINAMSKDQLKEYIKEIRKEEVAGTTIIREDKPSSSSLHPTMKPVAMIGEQITNSSRKGEIVLDLFGGSGSTLIACEQLGRHARLMELDPIYCDVIIERWENLTGEKAKRIN